MKEINTNVLHILFQIRWWGIKEISSFISQSKNCLLTIWRNFCIDFDYDRILVGYFAERGSSSLDQFVKGAAKQCPDQWPSRSPDRIGRVIDFMLYKFLKKCNLIGSKRKYVAFTGSMLKSLGLININRDLLT